jgi:hypothetical protein
MTIYYIDPVSGSDSNDALSFATAGKTLNNLNMNAGVQAGDEVRIVETPVVAINGNVKFTQQDPPTTFPSVTAASNASPIQITTSVANGLVTGDYVLVVNVTGNVGANGLWKITRLTDTSFSLDNSVGTGAYVSGGTVRKRSGTVVEFATPQVKNISLCGNQYQTAYPYCAGNWTASTGASCILNTNTTYATGSSLQIGVTATFTTGKIAYQNLGTTLDLSAWTHLNVLFSFVTSSVSVPADGIYYLALCSDTTGDTIVDTLPLNNVMVSATSGVNTKYCIQKQGGGNLGSSIKSISLYRSSAASGTANILIENVTAGLAPTTSNVNIRSLISDTIGFSGWYQLAGLTQDFAVLNACGNYLSGGVPTYYPGGDNSSHTANKLEGFDAGNLSTGQNYQNLTLSSPSTGYINLSGGWTRASSMTTQSSGGLSIWSCGTSLGVGLSANTKTNLTFDSIGFANFNNGFVTQAGASNIYISNCYLISNTLGANLLFTSNVNIGIKSDETPGPCYATQNTSGITLNGILGSARYCAILCNAASPGITVSGSSNYINELVAYNCGGYAVSHNAPCSNYDSVTTFGNYGLGAIQVSASSGFSRFNNLQLYSNVLYGNSGLSFNNSNGNIVTNSTISSFNSGVSFTGCNSNSIINTTFSSNNTPVTTSNSVNNNFNKCTGLNFPGSGYFSATAIGSYVTFTNCRDATPALLEGVYYVDNCYIRKSSAVSHSGTYSWSVYVGAYSGLYGWKNENCPVKNPLSKIQCTANRTYTVSVWVLRTDGLNQNAYLLCMGGQIAGVTNDVVSSNASASDNVWEQLTLPSFTPTENGVVQIVGCNYGSSTSLIHWDDINIVEA